MPNPLPVKFYVPLLLPCFSRHGYTVDVAASELADIEVPVVNAEVVDEDIGVLRGGYALYLEAVLVEHQHFLHRR